MANKILLIITGSVAAYKAIELARLLQKNSFAITCILTKAAQEFITNLQLSSVMKNKVYSDLFSSEDDGMTHIKLSRDNDLIIVAPASADFIAKMANGFADDLASTTVLAANKPIIIAPAMNEKMWDNKSVQQNLITLKEKGVIFIDPASDVLACGEAGIGKMQEVNVIFDQVARFFENKNKLNDKKILITGGGTREMIDPVRFIGNDSSGKQAIALAKILSEMGANVTMIAANIHDNIPLNNQNIIRVKNADEMFNAVKNNLDKCDIFIGAAAVSDYKVKNPALQKIKKDENENLNLELVKNIDILNYVSHAPNRPKFVIGFAAESENLIENAKEKLHKKNCDLIIANDIENGNIFGSDFSRAYIVSQNNIDDLGKINKIELAQLIGSKIADALP